MSEDYLDRILKDTKNCLKNRKLPIARCDKKFIFVTYDFDLGNIENVRLKATKKDWKQFYWERYEKDFSYDDIKPYLSRPTAEIKIALSEYAEKFPTLFFEDFWTCIEATIEENPLVENRVKPRKSSPYGLSWPEKNEVTALSSRLYIYLQKIGKQSKKTWPLYVQKFLSAYKISEIDMKRNVDLQDKVRLAVSEYFGIEFGDRFWQSFVTDRGISLKRLKNYSHRINLDQDKYLSNLFKEFKN